MRPRFSGPAFLAWLGLAASEREPRPWWAGTGGSQVLRLQIQSQVETVFEPPEQRYGQAPHPFGEEGLVGGDHLGDIGRAVLRQPGLPAGEPDVPGGFRKPEIGRARSDSAWRVARQGSRVEPSFPYTRLRASVTPSWRCARTYSPTAVAYSSLRDTPRRWASSSAALNTASGRETAVFMGRV